MGRIILQTLVLCLSVIQGWSQTVTNYRVIDGDTVAVRLNLGYDISATAHIRLSNFSAPELHERGGPEAKTNLETILGKATQISVSPTGKKSFDRWVGQIFVDGVDVTSLLSPTYVSSLQDRLDAAGKIAVAQNKSITVVVEEGTYDFVTLRVPPHVSLVATQEATRSVRLRHIGDGDQTLILVAGNEGYGTRISGFEILATAPRCVGIEFEKTINAELNNVRLVLKGEDSVGVRVKGKESISLTRLESRATVPVEYVWGDNIAFHDCDLGCMNNGKNLKNTVVLITGMPNQVIFDGSQTWQGGDYAIYGEVTSAKSGQGLNVYNMRYEQSTSLTKDIPAFYLNFKDRHLETFLLMGCRYTDRKFGAELTKIGKTTAIGGRLMGTWIEDGTPK